jgi:hypothetical protein
MVVANRGGEDQTFTEVGAFGGGCVAPLNAVLGLSPVPECSVLASSPAHESRKGTRSR